MIDKLTEEQRKVLIIWCFFGLFLAGLIIILSTIKWKEKVTYITDKDYSLVRDYSRYYTINGILDKFYNSINEQKYSSTLKMLNSKYISDNNINESNIKELFNYDVKVAFKGGLMCSKRFDKGFTSYYVSGDVIGQNVDKEFDKVYYEVVLNEYEMTFSISAIDASIFGGVCYA